MSKVLIVDDSQGTLDIIEHCVHRFTKDTITASDGSSAWELFLEHKPDLVITDYKMPGMNGLELALQIEKVRKELPIILVTGCDDVDENVKSHFKNIFSKPFSIGRFQNTVKKLLGLPES